MNENDKDKPFKKNMSFEDILRKAATTKMDPAIQINKKGKKYSIPGAAGKKVLFIQLAMKDKDVSKFILELHLQAKNGVEKHSMLFPTISRYQETKDFALFEKLHPDNPILVSIDQSLTVSVVSAVNYPTEDFEVGSLTYKILPS